MRILLPNHQHTCAVTSAAVFPVLVLLQKAICFYRFLGTSAAFLLLELNRLNLVAQRYRIGDGNASFVYLKLEMS